MRCKSAEWITPLGVFCDLYSRKLSFSYFVCMILIYTFFYLDHALLFRHSFFDIVIIHFQDLSECLRYFFDVLVFFSLCIT